MVFILSVLYGCAGDFGIRSLRHASHHTSRSSMARFYLSDGHIFAWRPPVPRSCFVLMISLLHWSATDHRLEVQTVITGTPLYAGYRTFAFWSTLAGGNARHASTDLVQGTPELENAAVAARNAFVGAQRPPNLQRE